MSSTDGGLRSMFSQNLRRAQWTVVESGSLAPGTPDAEFCFPGNKQGWIEYKKASGNRVVIRDLQVSWIDRRARLGGHVFIAVRSKNDLLLYHGRDVKKLAVDGLKGAVP